MSLKSVKIDLHKHPILKQYWYYTIELLPDLFTPGEEHPNVQLTRRMLKNTQISGKTVVDLGTMEGLLSTLAARRGARKVEAYDRKDLSPKVRLVKEAYEVDFSYVTGYSFAEYARRKQAEQAKFDVVIFSGFLYHMFDPFGGLARLRGLAHRGSLVLVETAAMLVDAMALFYNAEQRLYPHSNYFFPSPANLESMLRFVGLRPVDCLHLGNLAPTLQPVRRGFFRSQHPVSPPRLGTKEQIGRICVACRVDEIQALRPDVQPSWVKKYSELDFQEFLSIEGLAAQGDEVEYDPVNTDLFWREDGSLNLWQTICQSPSVAIRREEVILSLGDVT